MADLYIAELTSAVSVIGTTAPTVPPFPPITVQKIAIGGASVPSNAFDPRTKALLLIADGACHFEVAETPVAAATSMLLPANVPLVIGVPKQYKIAVIT